MCTSCMCILTVCVCVCARVCVWLRLSVCVCVCVCMCVCVWYMFVFCPCSATWPPGVRRLADQYLTQQPFQVTVGCLDLRVRGRKNNGSSSITLFLVACRHVTWLSKELSSLTKVRRRYEWVVTIIVHCDMPTSGNGIFTKSQSGRKVSRFH